MYREFVFRAIFGFLIFVLLLGLPESRLYADSKADQVDVSELYREYPVVLGSSLREGWFDPWPHKHFSRNGTPLVHSFGLEPAFLDRDFFLDTRWINTSNGDELEIEAELEWAISRRLGMVVELPYLQLSPNIGKNTSGVGDLAIAPRFLLGEFDRILLSANLEIGLPSGDLDQSLGKGETALAPSVSVWMDLGSWITIGTQLGIEEGVKSGESELFYNASLGYSFLTHGSKENLVYRHFPRGLSHLILELTGRIPLDEDGWNAHSSELLFGVSHTLTEYWEIRGGYIVPLGRPRIMDYGITLGLIYHF